MAGADALLDEGPADGLMASPVAPAGAEGQRRLADRAQLAIAGLQ
jgi:hypothetical protein